MERRADAQKGHAPHMSADGLSLLDLSSLAVDGPTRPATFGVILHFESKQDLDVLRAGARRAMQLYPRSSSHVQGLKWIQNPAQPSLDEMLVESLVQLEQEASQFLSERLEPSVFPLLRQRLIHYTDAVTGLQKSALVTHAHHVLGDGIALLLWLSAQLRLDTVTMPVSDQELRARKSSQKTKRPWSRTEPSPVSHGRSSQKRYRTVWLDEVFLRERLKELKLGVTLHDLLAAWIFMALQQVTAQKTASRDLSLWVPVSVRRDPFSFFGNASSRVRLRWDRKETSVAALARSLHVQMEEALASGVWDLGRAAEPLKLKLSQSLLTWSLRTFFARPGMDPCTSAFSFASRVSRAEDADAFPGVERMETVGHLYQAHGFAFSGSCLAGKLGLTLFWDPAALEDQSAQELFEALQEITQILPVGHDERHF